MFREQGIALILLKGLSIVQIGYRDLSARTSGDLDLMVEWRRLADAVRILEELGYHARHPYALTDAGPGSWQHLPRFARAGSTDVELHWTIDATAAADPADLWRRAVPAQMGDFEVLVLGHEDLLVHVCGHASHMHGFEFGLRPLCDIAALVERFGSTLDWEAVVAYSHDRGWARGNGLALRFAKRLLGASVPDDVLRRLAPKPEESVWASALASMSAPPAERAERTAISPNLAAYAEEGFLRKLYTGSRALVRSRRRLARTTPVILHSGGRLAYTLARARHVWTINWRFVFRTLRQDARLRTILRQKRSIRSWLEDSTT